MSSNTNATQSPIANQNVPSVQGQNQNHQSQSQSSQSQQGQSQSQPSLSVNTQTTPTAVSPSEISSSNPINVNGINSAERQPKVRFGWVKRLMQGQTRQAGPNRAVHRPENVLVNGTSSNGNLPGSLAPPRKPIDYYSRSSSQQKRNDIKKSNDLKKTQEKKKIKDDLKRKNDNAAEIKEKQANDEANALEENGSQNADNASQASSDNDEQTLESDNISTIPLKSIMSVQSTKSPSILSERNHDVNSFNASTVETSIAPSMNTVHYNSLNNPNSPANSAPNVPIINTGNANPSNIPIDRDSESIVTLASSSRRTRRRSIDTNCSTAGIPPASIMERLSVHPTPANGSTYAGSVRTSQIEPSQSSLYDSTDQNSSLRSEVEA